MARRLAAALLLALCVAFRTPRLGRTLPKLTAAKIPLSLVWGESDPWIRPAAADKIQSLKPDTQRVSIDAGHCPHDEAPEAVNKALSAFMAGIDA